MHSTNVDNGFGIKFFTSKQFFSFTVFKQSTVDLDLKLINMLYLSILSGTKQIFKRLCQDESKLKEQKPTSRY